MELASAPLTLFLLAITVVTSWQAWERSPLFEKLLHSPYRIHQFREYYRILSHALIHGDGTHLIFNMIGLFMFGKYLEAVFTHGQEVAPSLIYWPQGMGYVLYLALYAGGIAAGALPSIRKHRDHPGYRSVGASGGVSALLMAFAIVNPTAGMSFIFLPFFTLPAFIWILIFFAMEHYLARRGGTGIAHDAHIYGAIYGILFILLISPKLGARFISEVSAYFLG
ncbi:MAG: rhomboid family intramembrane serine protease [Flavobacteriales bacterium]|nr:rhomboid family intramembrane serine protease [Flavobacteriales bacterium]